LAPRVRPHWNVFEFGSGNSTLWWSSRVASVTACEHSLPWLEAQLPNKPQNARYIHREEGAAYPAEILNHTGPFDVVVIDGKNRNECAEAAPSRLATGGIIIWDNTELKKFKPGLAHLRNLAFRKVDFSGFGPALARPWMTSILYRDGNCLNL
jgi:predicted O-methyltransferase YrrM